MRLSHRKILLVDEDSEVQRHFSELLMRNHLEVCMASDAAGALRGARRQKPDLILVNMGLPAGGGALAIERLQQLTTTKTIPIVAFSNENPATALKEALLKGAKDFISKKSDDQEIIDSIRRHLHLGN